MVFLSSFFQKQLGNCMAEFQIEIVAQWSDGKFIQLSESNTPMEDEPNFNSENEQ